MGRDCGLWEAELDREVDDARLPVEQATDDGQSRGIGERSKERDCGSYIGRSDNHRSGPMISEIRAPELRLA